MSTKKLTVLDKLDNRVLQLPPERTSDRQWTNLREHDIKERWDPTIAPWVAAEHAARIDHALGIIKAYCELPARVIDVGCAQGTLGHLLAELGFDVTLVDVRPSHIAYARARAVLPTNVKYCVGMVPAVPRRDDFDMVICTEVIEHTPAPRELIDGLRQKCKLGGLVYLTTPNGAYKFSGLPTYTGVSNDVLVAMEVNSDDGDDHRFAYTLNELIAVVRSAGLSIREAGIFLPFWIVGYAKTKSFHRLNMALTGRPIRHYPQRSQRSSLSQAVGTSLYIVAEKVKD
ncbi:hypothetical protein BH20ACT1_BH20ACT1_00810 [soil metagenome]